VTQCHAQPDPPYGLLGKVRDPLSLNQQVLIVHSSLDVLQANFSQYLIALELVYRRGECVAKQRNAARNELTFVEYARLSSRSNLISEFFAEEGHEI
jgi:hypothetical protein